MARALDERTLRSDIRGLAFLRTLLLIATVMSFSLPFISISWIPGGLATSGVFIQISCVLLYNFVTEALLFRRYIEEHEN